VVVDSTCPDGSDYEPGEAFAYVLGTVVVLVKEGEVVHAACEAWRKLLAQPDTITSIGTRDWARVGQR